MADDRRAGDRADAPGTLTRLIEEVVKGASSAPEEGVGLERLRSGLLIGRYELLREVGRGGFGVVWEARDRELGRTVAFKALRVGGEAAREKRLLAEAEVAARLSHPNIVTVLDVGRSEHGVHLVQEFLTGAPLSKRLSEGRLPLREALRIATELARGLAHAHAHGVVHRDLTPGNVQLCDDGQVKLLDLGMAAALGRRKLDGGTPAYMAPEQAEAAPEDERTDVYALGALLYRMLTGVAPVSTDAAGRQRSASRGLEVPEAPALAALVEAMLARAPTDRPRDAQVVLEALQEISEALPRSLSGPSRVRVRPPPRARWITTGVMAGLLAAALLGLPAALWFRGAGPAQGAAAGAPARLILAGTSAQTSCEWKEVFRTDFDSDKVKLAWRNGDYFGQELRKVDGVPVWFMGADWNQLWVPIGDVKPDVFAVHATFFVPPGGEFDAGAALEIFTDPVGPMHWSTSDQVHGGGIALQELPGRPPSFAWQFPSGSKTARTEYRGTLEGSFTGKWRTLRIEGSRSGGWLRASLDGHPIVVDVGARDLEGRHICLTGGTTSYHQANVMWKHLRVLEGGPGCR